MVNQKQLSKKLKTTSKMVQRTRKILVQRNLNTPATPVVNNEQGGIAESNRKVVKEEFKAHGKIIER